MGQKRPVQIVNFVAKGTIEEGMLSVLAFKRSPSAGILDSGQSEIALGGSRLSRFMREVENVTGRMGEGEAVPLGEEAASVASAPVESPAKAATADESVAAAEIVSAGDASVPGAATPSPQEAAVDPWPALMQAGAQLVSCCVRPAIPRQRRIPGSSAIRRPARAACGCHCRRRRRRDGWPKPSR